MSDLPFWAFPAIGIAGLLGTGGIVMLMATSKRNNPPRMSVQSGAPTDLFDGTVVGDLSPRLNQGSGVFVRLSPTDVNTLRSQQGRAAAHSPVATERNKT